MPPSSGIRSIQINHDRCLRNVEKQNREQPKEEMRVSELRCRADPAGADDKKNLGQDEESRKAERLLESDALRALPTFCSARSSSFAHLNGIASKTEKALEMLQPTLRLRSDNLQRGSTLQPSNGAVVELVLRLCPSRRWRYVAELAVTNPAAGVGDVSSGAQGYNAEQNHRDHQWPGGFRPFYRHRNGRGAQDCENVKQPNQILGAVFVFVEPGLPISRSAIDSTRSYGLFAKFDKPARPMQR